MCTMLTSLLEIESENKLMHATRSPFDAWDHLRCVKSWFAACFVYFAWNMATTPFPSFDVSLWAWWVYKPHEVFSIKIFSNGLLVICLNALLSVCICLCCLTSSFHFFHQNKRSEIIVLPCTTCMFTACKIVHDVMHTDRFWTSPVRNEAHCDCEVHFVDDM